MPFHWQSCASFFAILIGYNVFSSLLQYWFYARRSETAASWKIQPKKISSLEDAGWWLPVLNKKTRNRHPKHRKFATINIVVASTFAGLTAEAIMRGYSRVTFESSNFLHICHCFILGNVWQCFVEYYWHRMMHFPWFYKRLHKWHHFYKSPEPFDDMFIHPVEAFGYYCILYAPPFLFPQPVLAFLLYMVVNGITGVMDHSGIKFSFAGIYNTEDHDLHHARFNVNYAFPFPFVDVLHGTYTGVFFGRAFTCSVSKPLPVEY